MLQALRFSNATHQMLVPRIGELQATRAKRLTFGQMQLSFHDHGWKIRDAGQPAPTRE